MRGVCDKQDFGALPRLTPRRQAWSSEVIGWELGENAAHLNGDDLMILVHAHAKLCREQVAVLIPGRVCSAGGEACVGRHIPVLPAQPN